MISISEYDTYPKYFHVSSVDPRQQCDLSGETGRELRDFENKAITHFLNSLTNSFSALPQVSKEDDDYFNLNVFFEPVGKVVFRFIKVENLTPGDLSFLDEPDEE